MYKSIFLLWISFVFELKDQCRPRTFHNFQILFFGTAFIMNISLLL